MTSNTRTAHFGLLAIGVASVILTGPRWGIAPLAWVAPVPWLLYARRAIGWRGWGLLLAAQLVAYSLQLLTIVTAPMPAILAIAFAIPAAVGSLLTIGLAEGLRRRTSDEAGVFGFAALVAIGDWLGYRHSEFGTWLASSNSQVNEPVVIQLAALGGLAGISFLMAWLASALAVMCARREAPRWPLLTAVIVIVAGLLYGTVRLDDASPGRVVRVAAVTTDLGLGDHGMPSPSALAANTDTLFARTTVAAARGARLVVWNEAATLVEPSEEQALVERGRRTARDLGVDIVLAYGVVVDHAPPEFDNKYQLISDRGEVLETYRKHHPVPGEPSLRGEEQLAVIERPYARVAGAICYDYDFPALAQTHAKLGAELVFVPASDWRGIDPIHTMMARVRAIEHGFSLVRSARWGASAAFDDRGRVRGWMSARDDNDRVMVADVPIGRSSTLYTATGDAVVIGGSFGWLTVALAIMLRRRRAGRA